MTGAADAVSKSENGSTAVGYPVYDGHGNRVATLTKSGSSFALGDLRSYDAWGNVLGTNTTGRPRGRYVANLGHVQDDESGLIYMRARYYEPGSGRFLSEDPGRQGYNWYSYCGNNPVNLKDFSGRDAISEIFNLFSDLIRGLGSMTTAQAMRITDTLEKLIQGYVDRQQELTTMYFEDAAMLYEEAILMPAGPARTLILEAAEAAKSKASESALKAKIAEAFGKGFLKITRELILMDE